MLLLRQNYIIKMQIKTLKLDLKVVVRETGSAQGDIYSTFQEEQVTDRTQCMSVRLNFHKSNVTEWSVKLQSLHLIAKRQTYYLFSWINCGWLIFWYFQKKSNVELDFLPFINQKITVLKLRITFTFAFKILVFI